MSLTAAELILVKHAMPVLDPSVPPSQWTLGEPGRQSAAALADHLQARLKGALPAGVFSSPEPKALQTAQPLADRLSLQLQAVPGLHEHERPVVPLESQPAFHAKLAGLFARPAELVYGAETADAAHSRFSAALNRLLEAHPTGSLVVVAHGTVISLYVSRLCGLEPFALWKRLGLPSYIALERPGLALKEIIDQI